MTQVTYRLEVAEFLEYLVSPLRQNVDDLGVADNY